MTVEDYIAAAPADVQGRLLQLRECIRATAPEAEERVSYGMPYYRYQGRPLVYFGLWKKHIGLYALSSTVLEAHQRELQGYVMEKGTIQLPLKEDLPLALVTSLLAAQRQFLDDSARR